MSPAVSDLTHSFATGFAPIAAPDASVLILGSLPSQLSLQKQEYYGNPQNAFWRVMGELFGARPDETYTKRARTLQQNGIAVWDVLLSSIRPGSMDAAIDLSTARPNDFPAFFDAHPDIELICFNGKKAPNSPSMDPPPSSLDPPAVLAGSPSSRSSSNPLLSLGEVSPGPVPGPVWSSV